MRKYHDLAEHAEPPFLGDFYLKVAARYRVMAKEAFDRADVEARRKKMSSQPSGGGLKAANGSLGFVRALRGLLGRGGHGYRMLNWVIVRFGFDQQR
jgi:hypothetical protein